MNAIRRALITLSLVLAGCHGRAGYEVDVRNLVEQPIVVALKAGQTEHLLASNRLGPGDRTVLYGEEESTIPVFLEADFAGSVSGPVRMDIRRGKMIVNVRKADPGVTGHLIFEEVQHP